MTLFNKAVFSIYQFNYPSFGESSKPQKPPFDSGEAPQQLEPSKHVTPLLAVTTMQIIVSIVYMLILEYFKYLEIESISLKTATMVSLLPSPCSSVTFACKHVSQPRRRGMMLLMCPAGVPSHLLLVAICGVRGYSLEIPDSSHVQVHSSATLRMLLQPITTHELAGLAGLSHAGCSPPGSLTSRTASL